MKAVIFAAGLGTRLYPYTKTRPKALVEVGGKTMLEHTIDRFISIGITEFIVNVHAFAPLMKEWIKCYIDTHPEVSIDVSDESNMLLETGGGLKNMKPLIGSEPFFVHNVDILSCVDLEKMRKFASGFESLAVLAVCRRKSDRYLLFNSEGLLCGWENVLTGKKKISREGEKYLRRFCFTGIHVIDPGIFPLIKEEGRFSITDVYLRLSADYPIRMFDISSSLWMDIGTPEKLIAANKQFS